VAGEVDLFLESLILDMNVDIVLGVGTIVFDGHC